MRERLIIFIAKLPEYFSISFYIFLSFSLPIKILSHLICCRFKRFDCKFIRPYLVRDHCGAEPKILETYSKLAMKDALDYIRRNASTIGNISGTESMSAIFRNYSNTGQFNGRCGIPVVRR